MMKCITLLLDGASDRSYPELDYKTPLQYAKTPNLDKLAAQSQCGLLTVLREGVALGTDLAHFLLFGYDEKIYPSRTIIDAIGEGVDIETNAVYLRCSFATVLKEEGYLIESRFTEALSDEEIKIIAPSLSYDYEGYHFEFMHSYDSHGFIKITGEKLSDKISDSDPFRNAQYVMKVEAFETEDKKTIEMANAVNHFIKYTYHILNEHPINQTRLQSKKIKANIILTKWSGSYNTVESFYDVNGKRGVLLGQSKLLKGLSEYIQMAYQPYDKFEEAVAMALTLDADYIHLHTKTPDTASHQKDPLLKVKTLETIDQAITPLLDFKGLLVVTSDHATPCNGQAIHSGESVAFMAKGPYIRRDEVSEFDEIACSKGSLTLEGKDFMNYIINGTDQGAMYHLKQGRRKRNYILKDVNKLV